MCTLIGMKRVYLLRHGKAESRETEKDDFERTLIERGRVDAEKIGVQMKKDSLVPHIIISSEARRAVETARICAESLGFDGEVRKMRRLYSASEEDYIEILREQDNSTASVMLVGHNPTIEDFNQSIMGRYRKIKTSNLIWYDIEISAWNELNFEVTVAGSGMLLF